MGEIKANIRHGETLFPIFQPSRLNGLGRMAAEAGEIDSGHDVTFRSLATRSVLNRSVSKRLKWMAWSINPYRGCEFGCRYCYARYTHEFLAPAPSEAALEASVLGPSARPPMPSGIAFPPLARKVPSASSSSSAAAASRSGSPIVTGRQDLRDPEAFEREIFIKSDAPWLLEQELRRLQKQGRIHEEIALGTATDPWQPIERRTRLTRSLLAVMSRHAGLQLGVVTKSTLIERDLDLLRLLHEKGTLVVHVTITTPDAELARKLEPRAPRPDLRFATVKRLADAGLRVGILNSPLLPGITDSPVQIDTMARLAAAAGASFFSAGALFLKSCSRPTYFDFIREHFPHLQTEYVERFRANDFASRPYLERTRALVTASCKRHGLHERSSDSLLTRETGGSKPGPTGAAGQARQQRLFA